ncbi:MAG: hypothetical protein L6R40_003511 [Gallowayella cf. fulva]|nr:MAG: hypothetical protein L6R40_003511 [Xanthomendoza cf. fulva]
MASISKLIPSIASGSLEFAPALANLNFDFALWKVAAPKEFEGVGSALSTCRRDDAETGTLHTIARKLGALFERKVPWTPALTKAYGTRASEIAQALSLDGRGRKSYGVFASRAGADATSLWAAATSGTSAISIHLLACLLARIWDAPEATSIWVEIIKRRKEEVLADFDVTDVAHLATLSAARQDLPRAQIAEWDDSARAWLRVADGVKKKQQKQLMLILDNVQVPVNGKTDTYESVMEAWSNSLTQMDALVQGISQQARKGDILLALSSWHLFPDLTVVTPSMTHIRQNDPVFGSGGVLTIGLQTPVVQDKGVHWSLPLACLRHYGAPVVSARSIRSGIRSRLSLQELLQATLGSLLQSWGPAGTDTLRSMKWISSIYHILLEETKLGYAKASMLTKGSAEHSWLALLSEAANLYMVSDGLERQHNNKLISLGRKHGRTFLGTPAEPAFGLLAQGRFVKLMADERERIELLRKVGESMAKNMRIDSSQIFIRYKHHISDSAWVYEYATAIPYNTGKKRRADGTSCSVQSHHRWLYSGSCTRRKFSCFEYVQRWETLWKTQANWDVEERYALTEDLYRSAKTNSTTAFRDFERREALLTATGERVSKREDQHIEDLFPADVGIYRPHCHGPPSCFDSTPWYSFAFGAIEDTALFITEKSKPFIDLTQTLEENARILYSTFEGCRIDTQMVTDELERNLRHAQADVDPHLKSLKAISTAAMMFRHFPSASVDVRILQEELFDASWVRTCTGPMQSGASLNKLGFPSITNDMRPTLNKMKLPETPECLQPYTLSKAQAFACLAMFESGQHDIDPGQLIDVMAMSSGDSIFVSAAMLVDPYNEIRPGDIRGFMGNIGRPGIAFLVPPKAPLTKEVSIDEWDHIERNEFDGCLSDHFQNTSLHLSFTTAETPLNVRFSGGQDLEACILETLFSIYEGGSWIADLNVSNVQTSIRLSRMPRCVSGHPLDVLPSSIATCIDSWLGLVDAPEERVSLVRAHGNWQARLAASSISIALGYNTIILPDNVCWKCFDGFAAAYHGHVIAIG